MTKKALLKRLRAALLESPTGAPAIDPLAALMYRHGAHLADPSVPAPTTGELLGALVASIVLASIVPVPSSDAIATALERHLERRRAIWWDNAWARLARERPSPAARRHAAAALARFHRSTPRPSRPER